MPSGTPAGPEMSAKMNPVRQSHRTARPSRFECDGWATESWSSIEPRCRFLKPSIAIPTYKGRACIADYSKTILSVKAKAQPSQQGGPAAEKGVNWLLGRNITIIDLIRIDKSQVLGRLQFLCYNTGCPAVAQGGAAVGCNWLGGLQYSTVHHYSITV